MLLGQFTAMVWFPLAPLLLITAVILADQLYPMIKHFYPNVSGLCKCP